MLSTIESVCAARNYLLDKKKYEFLPAISLTCDKKLDFFEYINREKNIKKMKEDTHINLIKILCQK
jgi:hypothetical protein